VSDRRLSADDRYDLAVSADAASRRNRPSHLVVFAGLFFVVACAVLGFASCEARQASDDLDSRVSQRDAIASMLAELKAMEQAADPDADAVNDPYPGFRSKMEEIAQQVGLSEALEFADRRTPPSGIPGVTQVTYDYEIEEPTLEPLLAFARAATEQVPGTRIGGLRLRPRPDKWQMDIKFERFERNSQP